MQTSCTCPCGLHDSIQQPSARSPSDLQHIETFDNRSDADALSSPRYESYEDEDEDEDSDAMSVSEREEAGVAVAMLQLQVRALRKYKSNYELLCGQLSELNTQIGLQLQRHEADVAALQASIADLQTEKMALEVQASEAQKALSVQREAATQDREYSEHVHRQLSTAAELLKATDKRLEQQEEDFAVEMEQLRSQLAVRGDECEEYQATAKKLMKELAAAKEEELSRRRREKSKHKKELMANAARLRAVGGELEAQRSVLRATKKQLGQAQTDNDALRKQLSNVKRDGAHLSDIIDSQRVEHESHTDELLDLKKAKKKLAKRVAALSQEVEQLQNELSDAKEELVYKNGELESCSTKLKALRSELRQTTQALDDAQSGSDKLLKQLGTLQNVENGRRTKAKEEEQKLQASRELQYNKEIVRMRELLADNQQRSTESSRDVQKLRRELVGVQKLLRRRTEERNTSPEPIDQWAEVMRNSVKADKSVLTSAIMKKVRTLAA